VTDASKPAAAQRGYLRRDEFFFATAQPGSTRSTNTYVKTDASFKQRRTEAEDSHGGRKLFPLLCSTDVEVRRACSREQFSLRRSDSLSYIQSLRKRKSPPK
jgi:hypothetical protein